MYHTGWYVAGRNIMLDLQTEPTATRERILAAASHTFARKGYQAASLDEVAQFAGMTKGAIYWHFRSKNDLFFALLDHKFQLHTAPVPEDLRVAAATANPRQAVTVLLQTMFARLRTDAEWPRLYLEFIGQARDNEMRERLARFHADGMALVAQHIRTMQGAGLAPGGHDATTQAAFWGALFDGLMLAWLINPHTDHDALITHIVDLLWHGIAPDAVSATATWETAP